MIPSYRGNIMAKCNHRFLNLIPYADENGIDHQIQTLSNCSLISLGRSMMVTSALKDKDWTHLFWMTDVKSSSHFDALYLYYYFYRSVVIS